MLKYFVLAALIASMSPASASSLVIVSDESWICEGSNYIGNAVKTYADTTIKATLSNASWIWKASQVENPTAEEAYMFQKEFNVPAKPTSSLLSFSADDSYAVFLNGNFIASSKNKANGGQNLISLDLTSRTVQGRNVVQVVVINWSATGATYTTNPAGLLFRLEITY